MIQLEIISFQKHIFSNLVNKIIVYGIEGELGIYPKHISLLTIIKPGLLKIFYKNKYIYIYIIGGILDVQYKKIIILSDIAILYKKKNMKKIKYFIKLINKLYINKNIQKLNNFFLNFDILLKEINK